MKFVERVHVVRKHNDRYRVSIMFKNVIFSGNLISTTCVHLRQILRGLYFVNKYNTSIEQVNKKKVEIKSFVLPVRCKSQSSLTAFFYQFLCAACIHNKNFMNVERIELTFECNHFDINTIDFISACYDYFTSTRKKKDQQTITLKPHRYEKSVE